MIFSKVIILSQIGIQSSFYVINSRDCLILSRFVNLYIILYILLHSDNLTLTLPTLQHLDYKRKISRHLEVACYPLITMLCMENTFESLNNVLIKYCIKPTTSQLTTRICVIKSCYVKLDFPCDNKLLCLKSIGNNHSFRILI